MALLGSGWPLKGFLQAVGKGRLSLWCSLCQRWASSLHYLFDKGTKVSTEGAEKKKIKKKIKKKKIMSP